MARRNTLTLYDLQARAKIAAHNTDEALETRINRIRDFVRRIKKPPEVSFALNALSAIIMLSIVTLMAGLLARFAPTHVSSAIISVGAGAAILILIFGFLFYRYIRTNDYQFQAADDYIWNSFALDDDESCHSSQMPQKQSDSTSLSRNWPSGWRKFIRGSGAKAHQDGALV